LTLYHLSDAHFYLTGNFVLSWSMLQAMSSGCCMIGSATAPVQEVITDGVNGLLADFYDHEGHADNVLKALADPAGMQAVRGAARETVLDRYSLDKCLNQLVGFFEETVADYAKKKAERTNVGGF
jgi:glycosyltransferase involved in cell wall biosynthesis